jgi:hypothetical protein
MNKIKNGDVVTVDKEYADLNNMSNKQIFIVDFVDKGNATCYYMNSAGHRVTMVIPIEYLIKLNN